VGPDYRQAGKTRTQRSSKDISQSTGFVTNNF
jgi:hypothetical protein